MATNLDQFPNVYITTLKQSLALGGNETSIVVSSIKTFDGQEISSSDFALLGRGVLSIAVESVLAAEFISFTGIDNTDPSNPKFTGAIRGLSFKNDSTS
jgi:hypothetical protein